MTAPNVVDMFKALHAKTLGRPTLDEVIRANKRAEKNMQASTQGIYRTPREEIEAWLTRINCHGDERQEVLDECVASKESRAGYLQSARGDLI